MQLGQCVLCFTCQNPRLIYITASIFTVRCPRTRSVIECYVHAIAGGLTNPAPGVLEFDGWRALQPIYDAAKLAGIFIVLRPGTWSSSQDTYTPLTTRILGPYVRQSQCEPLQRRHLRALPSNRSMQRLPPVDWRYGLPASYKGMCARTRRLGTLRTNPTSQRSSTQ